MKLTKLLFSLLAVNQCEASTGAVIAAKTATDAAAIKAAGEVLVNVAGAVNPAVAGAGAVGLLAYKYLGLNSLT